MSVTLPDFSLVVSRVVLNGSEGAQLHTTQLEPISNKPISECRAELADGRAQSHVLSLTRSSVLSQKNASTATTHTETCYCL